MTLKRFCPACGSEKGPFIQGLCRECFLQKQKLVEVPEKIEVTHCPVCNKIKLKGNGLSRKKRG